MRLAQLLEGDYPTGGLPEVEIRGVAADSRQVEPGAVFVAVRGQTHDGHAYLPQAAARGAAFLVGESPDPGLAVPYLRVDDSRLFLARAAAAWNGHPARRLGMIGVTGTDGKTTTSSLLHHILEAAGGRTGLITSVGARIGPNQVDTGFHVTTPDPLELQALLARMVEAGMSHAVVEVTSHGLDQQRVAATEFDLGLLTNITHEHLDYHGTYQAYLAAKGLLFQSLAASAGKSVNLDRLAVLNRDDSSFDPIRTMTSVPVIGYGEGRAADFRAVEVRQEGGLGFRLVAPGVDLPIETRLLGRYNVANCLAAVAAAVAGLRVSPAQAAAALGDFPGVPGRMERIDLGQPFAALVDFAHTPNSLRRALEAARSLTQGRVIAVFGAAGLRDREKRRLMPEISCRLADATVLTAEDPRTESLEAILADMAVGAQAAGGREGADFWRIPDRGEALRFAVGIANPGDLVIVCGKGHEQSMAFGEVEHAWDDRVALQAALAGRLGKEGPPMPVLPTSSA